MGDSNGTALHEAFPLLRQANPLRDNHRFAEAEALVRRAVALAPHSPLTWIDLGLLLRCAGRLDEAEQAYRHAVSRPLGILHAGPQLAGLLLQTDRAEEGLDTFRASLAMSRTELERDGLYIARPSGVPFSHIALCLLEGLEGCIPIHAAEALDHDGRRLAEAGRAAKDCALVLVDVSESQAMPPNLAGIAPNRLMVMGQQDSVNDLMLPRQAMFAAHQNRFWPVPGLRLPWGFGLSRRMIRDIGTPPPYHQRGRNVVRAFRPSRNQDIRNLLDLTLLPALERILPVDRGLDQGHAYHHAAASDFYDRLKQAYACLAYGGGLRVSLSGNPFFIDSQSLISHHITAGPVVDRWDSWRFWESLAAGCATVHLDFQKYGFLLPEMPRPFQHYLPIDLENPSEIVGFLHDQPEKLAEIASAGRDFALQYYSPDRVAARFLSLVCS